MLPVRSPDDVRKMLDRTPKFLLPPLIVEDTRGHNGTALTFAYRTRGGAVVSALLAEVVDEIAARAGARRAGLPPRSTVAGHGLSIVTTVA